MPARSRVAPSRFSIPSIRTPSSRAGHYQTVPPSPHARPGRDSRWACYPRPELRDGTDLLRVDDEIARRCRSRSVSRVLACAPIYRRLGAGCEAALVSKDGAQIGQFGAASAPVERLMTGRFYLTTFARTLQTGSSESRVAFAWRCRRQKHFVEDASRSRPAPWPSRRSGYVVPGPPPRSNGRRRPRPPLSARSSLWFPRWMSMTAVIYSWDARAARLRFLSPG